MEAGVAAGGTAGVVLEAASGAGGDGVGGDVSACCTAAEGSGEAARRLLS